METIFTERHRLRNSKTELFGGKLVEPFERPSRAEYIISRVHDVTLGPVNVPDDFGLGPIFLFQINRLATSHQVCTTVSGPPTASPTIG